MTKAELMNLVGKKVAVTLKDGDKICGILGYAEEFSAKYHYIRPNYFYIDNYVFKVSYVKKAESEGEDA